MRITICRKCSDGSSVIRRPLNDPLTDTHNSAGTLTDAVQSASNEGSSVAERKGSRQAAAMCAA